ncbi:MAG: anti-sigma F factor [Ruminococcaceae bacterium]|nr:anti-sigma F factor [Oscillospiraceae bacterium]
MKKELLNSLKMTFISKSENEALARQTLSSFISRFDPTIEDLADIRTVVSEAVTNCIVHAYKNLIGDICIYAKLYNDGTLFISVKDKGCGIENVKKAMEPLYTTDTSGERGGMGFAIMENFTDSLKVRSVRGKGTTVTMKKKLTYSE